MRGASLVAAYVRTIKMTDYYPLLTRTVAALERNTAETRRSIYVRARTTLTEQLRTLDPPLSESKILYERTALEQAIRKIEVESARRAPAEPSRSSAKPASPSKLEPSAPPKSLPLA